MDIPLYPFLSLADERMRILIARATRKKNKGKGREEGVTKRNGCRLVEAGFVAKGIIGKEERREEGGRGAGVLIGRTENCIFEIN